MRYLTDNVWRCPGRYHSIRQQQVLDRENSPITPTTVQTGNHILHTWHIDGPRALVVDAAVDYYVALRQHEASGQQT